MSHRSGHSYDDEVTEALPPSTLFARRPTPGSESVAPQFVEVPTKRAVWRIVLTVVAATIAVIALALGGYLFYAHKTTEISHLKKERQHLRATNDTLRSTNETLSSKVVITATSLHTAKVKLAKSTKAFSLTKKNLTKMRKDLIAANELADANYDLGYKDGSTTGYDSGRSAGLVQGSDSLTFSDDADVTWLPACSDY